MFPSTSSPSTSSTSPLIIQAARRLLLHNTSPYLSTSNKAAPPVTVGGGSSHPYKEEKFDANVVMVLSILLCAIVCALCLNSIIRCALRLSNGVSYINSESLETKLKSTGVKKKALKSFPVVTYSAGMKQPGSDVECVICLSEFATGERLRVLPHCNHGFHIQCIDKWLMQHTSCPTCRDCLIDTCQKIVDYTQARSTPSPATVAQLQRTIAPLEHEDFIRKLNNVC